MARTTKIRFPWLGMTEDTRKENGCPSGRQCKLCWSYRQRKHRRAARGWSLADKAIKEFYSEMVSEETKELLRQAQAGYILV